MIHTHTIKIVPITYLDEAPQKTLVIEVLSEHDISKYISIFGGELKERAHDNLKKKKDREKILSFHMLQWKFELVTLFFPESDELMEDRSSFFRTLTKDIVFIPSSDEVWAHEAMFLASYHYQKYLTKKKEHSHSILLTHDSLKKIKERVPLYEAIFEARDIINEPPSSSYPEIFVEHINSHKWKHFDLHIFGEKELKKLGCNLLLAVGAGSDFPPYMVVLTPKKKIAGEKYALIGKWVTFDAWGIQIKPDTAMVDMKCDMSGAAGMLGVAKYLDTLKELPVNVIIAMGITENMTGGKAFKPLDIYRAYNGTTVEIHHTDAEWRLVLADVMSYVEDTYKVDHIITMATLTGACIYALGHDFAGIMWDDEKVISALMSTSSPYEPLWRLPLTDKFKKSLKTDIADLKNITRTEKAWSSIGGAFLSYFQWKAKLTHLDIAGPAFRETNWGYMPKGATGWGVRILSDFLVSLAKPAKNPWKK